VVVLFKKFDEGLAVYDGDFTEESLKAFVTEASLPLINEFTPNGAVFASEIKNHFFLFLPSAAAYHHDAIEALRELAGEFRGMVIFSHVDASSPSNSRVLDFFGVHAHDCPTVRFFRIENNNVVKFFPDFKDIDAEMWGDWLQEVFDGQHQPFYKSEPPVPYEGKGVRILTAKDHEVILRDSPLNIFVEYYAPWCGHCKELAPVWDKLAENLADHKNVLIAKMDSTKNEVPSVEIKGFPTLKFYPPHGASALAYDGPRDFDSLKEYVLKNSVESDHDEL